MNNIKAVVFDLDNTLIERRKAVAHVAHALIREYFSDRSKEYCFIKERFCDCFKDGYLKNRDCYTTFCQQINWENAPSYEEFFQYWSFFYPFSTTHMPDMVDTLQCLKAKGYLLGIVTNGPIAMQNAKIEVAGIRELFDVIVVSKDYGIDKPAPEIFTYAADKLSCNVSECLYVGDHPRNDIFGAKNAGMNTAWLRGFVEWDNQYERADIEIDKLAQLKTIL